MGNLLDKIRQFISIKIKIINLCRNISIIEDSKSYFIKKEMHLHLLFLSAIYLNTGL